MILNIFVFISKFPTLMELAELSYAHSTHLLGNRQMILNIFVFNGIFRKFPTLAELAKLSYKHYLRGPLF
jgi:hypothetical protein